MPTLEGIELLKGGNIMMATQQKIRILSIVQQRLFLLLLIGMMCFSMVAQDRNARFQYLTLEDGLPQNMVDAMLQDSLGFMWFGTWNGLSRYDGYRFETFSSESHGINNFIHALLELPGGNLLIGTREGVYIYYYDEDRFAQIQLKEGENAPDQSSVHQLLLTQEEYILVGTERTNTEMVIVLKQE